MVKLTDTQMIVLSKAAQRDDGAATLPQRMNKAAASKVGSSLIRRKLMREIRPKGGMPIWREDADGRGWSLILMRAGRKAIDIENEPEAAADPIAPGKKDGPPPDEQKPSNHAPRIGSKQALVVDMLSKEKGASLDALVNATGWLPHTARAALTGLRKRGFTIERSRDGAKGTLYRIASKLTAPVAA